MLCRNKKRKYSSPFFHACVDFMQNIYNFSATKITHHIVYKCMNIPRGRINSYFTRFFIVPLGEDYENEFRPIAGP